MFKVLCHAQELLRNNRGSFPILYPRSAVICQVPQLALIFFSFFNVEALFFSRLSSQFSFPTWSVACHPGILAFPSSRSTQANLYSQRVHYLSLGKEAHLCILSMMLLTQTPGSPMWQGRENRGCHQLTSRCGDDSSLSHEPDVITRVLTHERGTRENQYHCVLR